MISNASLMWALNIFAKQKTDSLARLPLLNVKCNTRYSHRRLALQTITSEKMVCLHVFFLHSKTHNSRAGIFIPTTRVLWKTLKEWKIGCTWENCTHQINRSDKWNVSNWIGHEIICCDFAMRVLHPRRFGRRRRSSAYVFTSNNVLIILMETLAQAIRSNHSVCFVCFSFCIISAYR